MYPLASEAEPGRKIHGASLSKVQRHRQGFRQLRMDNELSSGWVLQPLQLCGTSQYLLTESFDLLSPGRRFRSLQHEAKAARLFCVQCHPVVTLHW